MFSKIFVLCVVLLHLQSQCEVDSHGMVLDPVNRGSRWRYTSDAPINYNDNGNFCGGYYAQHGLNNGQCGFCGDDFGLPRPRENEHGGKYGKGVIVKSYKQGSLIPVSVLLTANHMGYFYFNLCKMDGAGESAACFQQYPLRTSYGSLHHNLGSTNTGYYNVTLQLPAGVTCNHCVLQWTYYVGNSWGYCDDGTGALGCGPQENFRTCSDIAIST